VRGFEGMEGGLMGENKTVNKVREAFRGYTGRAFGKGLYYLPVHSTLSFLEIEI